MLAETLAEFLFCCISFRAVDFVQFIFNAVIFIVVSDNKSVASP
jgi:hypothetical protein